MAAAGADRSCVSRARAADGAGLLRVASRHAELSPRTVAQRGRLVGERRLVPMCCDGPLSCKFAVTLGKG